MNLFENHDDFGIRLLTCLNLLKIRSEISKDTYIVCRNHKNYKTF